MADNIDQMAAAIKQGIDNNGTDAPAMSIDPKTQQVSVVGDPNKIKASDGIYKLDFYYPAEELNDDDKNKMKQNPDNPEEYIATVSYVGKRVKPLFRTTVSMDIADMLTKMDVLTNDGGYSTDGLGRRAARVFLANIDVIARVAKNVLDIPEEQVQYLSPESLVEFFVQLMDNEPNLVKEAAGFLEPSSIKQLMKLVENDQKTNQQPNTPQN